MRGFFHDFLVEPSIHTIFTAIQPPFTQQILSANRFKTKLSNPFNLPE